MRGMVLAAWAMIAAGVCPAATVLVDFEGETFAASNTATKVSRTDSFVTSGSKALRCECGPWRETLFAVDIPETDLAPYDRICLDLVNEGPREDELNLHLAHPGEKPNVSFYSFSGMRGRTFAPIGKSVWTMSLVKWPKKTKDRIVSRLYFFCPRPFGSKITIDRIRLLKPGEADEPPTYKAEDAARIAALEKTETDRAKAERDAAFAAFRDRSAAAGLATDKMLVGIASSMSQVRPLVVTDLSRVDVPKEVSLRLAKDEYESVQVIVTPASEETLKDVRVTVSDLKTDGWFGSTLGADAVTSEVVGYVKTRGVASYSVGYTKVTDAAKPDGYERHGTNPRPGWWADSILPFLKKTDVKSGVAQGFWVRVKCPKDQKAGTYRGTLTVSAANAAAVKVPFIVRVNDFVVPRSTSLPLAITFNPTCSWWWYEDDADFAERERAKDDPESPVNAWKAHRDEWSDFLADYYITVNSLYYNMKNPNPDLDLLARQKARGVDGMINLGYWDGYGPSAKSYGWFETNMLFRFRRAYAEAKRLGLEKRVYLYGADEVRPEKSEGVARAAATLRKEFPGVPLFTTAIDPKYGVGTGLSCIDWFTPLTSRYDLKRADEARAQGHKVFWYICDGPIGEYANAHIENAPIDIRSLMGAQAAKMRPDGFLYWQLSYWNNAKPITSGPFTEWDPRSYKGFNGEGTWTAPGPDMKPMPTIRLENFRDGLEDLWYVKILKKQLAAHPAEDAWAKKARELVAVPDSLVVSQAKYSDDPAKLRAWRDGMADLIETERQGK